MELVCYRAREEESIDAQLAHERRAFETSWDNWERRAKAQVGGGEKKVAVFKLAHMDAGVGALLQSSIMMFARVLRHMFRQSTSATASELHPECCTKAAIF